MQLNQVNKANGYVLAGDRISPFERLVESSTVEVPECSQPDEEQRVAYRAPMGQSKTRRTVSLPMALLMILGVVAIMSMFTLQKMGQGNALAAELDQLSNRYVAAEDERRELEQAFLKACDSSYITYYAAQNLKMRRALHEETIQVTATSTRPLTQHADGAVLGMAGRN